MDSLAMQLELYSRVNCVEWYGADLKYLKQDIVIAYVKTRFFFRGWIA